MVFAVPADHRVRIRENENENEMKDKYSDLARQLRKLLNISRLVIPIVVGTLETVHKCLEKELEELEIGGRI